MTREEADFIGGMNMCDEISNEAYRKIMCHCEEQEPTMGHWITKPHVYGVTYCSECDFELKIDNTNYCPNCGADMREVEE